MTGPVPRADAVPSPHDGDPDDGSATQLSPEQVLAVIDAQRARVDANLEVDSRLLYGVWGVAWLLGYGGIYATSRADPLLDVSRNVAVLAFFALLAAALVVTVVHTARATRGVRGVSSSAGAMYGGSWALSFVALPFVTAAVARLGASEEVLQMLWTTLPPLLVGVLYMMGAAVWQDRAGFGLGAWILAITCLAALAGLPGVYLVMSLAGGGGFLAAAMWFQVRRIQLRRGRGRVGAS